MLLPHWALLWRFDRKTDLHGFLLMLMLRTWLVDFDAAFNSYSSVKITKKTTHMGKQM